MSNNFKELYKDEEPSEEVKKKVMANQRQIRHLSNYLELFLGNFFRSFSGLLQLGNTESKEKKSDENKTQSINES